MYICMHIDILCLKVETFIQHAIGFLYWLGFPLNQVHASWQLARTCFLEIAFVREVCMRVCVSASQKLFA